MTYQYGLSTLATSLKVTNQLIWGLEYTIRSFWGVNCNIKTGWGTLPRAFGGVGLLSLPIEHTTCSINMVIQHFGVLSILIIVVPTARGWHQIKSSLSLLYGTYKNLLTPCWLASLWDGCHTMTLRSTWIIPQFHSHVLRERDSLLVNIFQNTGFSGASLQSLNCCRLSWQALFLSYMTSVGGRQLKFCQLLSPLSDQDLCSYTFPRDEPTPRDREVWQWF